MKKWLKQPFRRGRQQPAEEGQNDSAQNSAGISSQPSKAGTTNPPKQGTTSDTISITNNSDPLKPTTTNTTNDDTEGTSQKAKGEGTAHIEDVQKDNSLWDRAYDALKVEQSHRIDVYEDLLSRVPLGDHESTTPILQEMDHTAQVKNQIPQYNTIARKEVLTKITRLGLKHMEDNKVSTTLLGHEIVLQDVMETVAGAAGCFEDYVKNAVKDLRYAPIIMAGISLLLPLMKNPTTVEAANREGFTYVTSQMRYYIAMESLLLPEGSDPGLRTDLTERLVDLYKLIIDFQTQSIIRFYRGRTKNFLRGVINYDSWAEKVQDIKKADADIISKFETAMSANHLEELRKLAQEAENSRVALNKLIDISGNCLRFAEKMDRHISDADGRSCLESLRATNPRHDKKRIEQEKGGLLRDSYSWVLSHVDFRRWRDDDQSRLLWIIGDPGKGKTMLLCGIIDELIKSASNTTNISFFFCQATHAHINSATSILRGLIYMLVKQQPLLISHLRESYGDGKERFEGVNAWVALSEVFCKILEDSRLQNTYLIIDALDECVVDLSLFLDLIIEKSSANSHIKWIVSSRNWPSIDERLGAATQKVSLCLELNKDTISAAVGTYIRHKVTRLADQKKYDSKMRAAVQCHLLSNANDTFLWVALVCEELKGTSRRHTLSKLNGFPLGLDDLYKRMMDQIRHSEDAEICQSILAVVSTAYRPLTLDELTAFVDLPDNDEEEIIALCGSFLTLHERIIHLVHQSAKDFLLSQASNAIFPSGIEDVHYGIFSRSLQVMSETLGRDVYKLDAPGFPIDQVKQPDPDPLAAARYSCVYWIDHLVDSSGSKNENQDLKGGGEVDGFLRKNYLFWLEALSLLGRLSDGVASMTKLEDSLKARISFPLSAFIQDANRFAQYNLAVLERTPLQVYCSALAFAPEKSIVRREFEKCIPSWIKVQPKMQENWNTTLLTLEGHTASVKAIDFSPNCTQLASGSSDQTVRLWDAVTGTLHQTLHGHGQKVTAVMYSPDGTQLASASFDRTVRLWDVKKGSLQKTLEGHSDWVNAIQYLRNGQQLASASNDRTVRLWDAKTGVLLQILKGHSDAVCALGYSPGGQCLASASQDRTVRLWEIDTGILQQTCKGHTEEIKAIAVSPDGKRLASGSDDGTVRVWDTETGTNRWTMDGHSNWIGAVEYSPSGRQLASASYDHTVRLWNAETGALQHVLEGHSNVVCALAYSPDGLYLASASWDETARLWDAVSGLLQQVFEGHYESLYAVKFSLDGRHLASASHDNTVRLWDTKMRFVEQNAPRHSGRIEALAFSPDGHRLASGSRDRTIRLWDTDNGTLERILEGHTDWVTSMAFSPDGRQLASTPDGGRDPRNPDLYTINIWDAATGILQHKLRGHSNNVGALAFSPDGLWLVSAAFKDAARIWDSTKGTLQRTLDMHSGYIRTIAFSPDGGRLASASADHMVRIYNFRTGAIEHTLEGHSQWVDAVAFSPDGDRLASASRDDTVRIWHAGTGALEQTFRTGDSDETWFGQYGSVMSIAFSADGQRLLTNLGAMELVNCNPGPQPAKWPSYSLPNVDRCWIMWNERKVLWLPVDYRPACHAFHGNFLAMGHESGRVTIMKLGTDVNSA